MMLPAAERETAYVGLDLGTSGVRAVAIDAAGTELVASSRPLPGSRRGADGSSEQSPADWWEASVAVLRVLTAELGDRRVEAISAAGTSGTLLLCDAQGIPRTPALMYDDGRARAQAARIADVAPPEAPVHGAGSALARLLWLIEQHATEAGPPLHALHQADWVLGRLAGSYAHSDLNNTLKLGYDPLARRWPAWMERLRLPAGLLPRVHPPGALIGRVGPAQAAETGLPLGCRVRAGTTDSTAATLAAVAPEPGLAVTSLGSTLVLKIWSKTPVFAARHGVYSHRVGALWLVGGASNSGGAVLEHFFSRARMEALSMRIDPDHRTGLDYYPLLRPGERFPVSDPAFPPRLVPRPADEAEFFQGLLEGIAAIEARGYRLLTELGAPWPRRVYSTGGGARNAVWRAIRQGLLGVPVELARCGEAAYGAALIARNGCAAA